MTTLSLLLLGGHIILVLVMLLTIAAFLVLAERRVLAWIQDRQGPNRVGPQGLLQPLADVIKMVCKEDLIPAAADKWIFLLAPAMAAVPALLTFAVVPMGPPLSIAGQEVPLQIIDLNIGILVFLALSAVAVYGVTLGGWASHSSYALLGGIRALAQLISYELSMGLSLVPVVMLAGTFSLTGIVEAQRHLPFILLQPVAFIIFFISILAECRRIPFDLPEAESELVAGFHAEYSGLRFGLFFVGEYINVFVLGSLATTLFLGGWHGPWLPPIIWFLGKSLSLCFVFIWLRGTLPRLRSDQLMHLGWKFLVPLALINIVVTGWWLMLNRASG